MAKVEVTLKPGYAGRSVPIRLGPGQTMMVGFEPGVAVLVPEEQSKWFRASTVYRVGPSPTAGRNPARTSRRKNS